VARVICISHATGAGGAAVGQLVARRLGLRFVDEEIVSSAAAKAAVDPTEIADEERRKSLARRILGALAHSEGAGMVGPFGLSTSDEIRTAEIREVIREAIVQTAARGDVVISAHAASHVLEPSSGTLRVLVTASPRTRASRVADSEELDDAAAARAVKEADAGRRDYLKRFYDIDDEQPTDYDLVVNTDHLSLDDAADIITRAATPAAPNTT
jgi:cytidylate kinase